MCSRHNPLRSEKAKARATFNTRKSHAKKVGIPFNLDFERDVWAAFPTHCPILGLALKSMYGEGQANDASPSLDRITPELGYVPGNVIVISNRANRIKNNATPAELRAVATFYTNLMSNK